MIDISLDDALKYLERVIDTSGQNSEDHYEIHDQTACHIADLLRKIVRERDDARAEIEQIRAEAIREAAEVCRSHWWARDIEWWMTASKKDVSQVAAEECVGAILALLDKSRRCL